MKTLEFIYQENEIHFLVNPMDKNVMVNATEMAKPFNKRVRNFLRLEETKLFTKLLLEKENSNFDSSDVSGQKEEKDIFYTTNKATFMHRKLALKFAAWLDVEFELWVFETLDEIIFGNYKKHWEAHARQEAEKVKMEDLKNELLTQPTVEKAIEYFEAEKAYKTAKYDKTKAIRSQLKLFNL